MDFVHILIFNHIFCRELSFFTLHSKELYAKIIKRITHFYGHILIPYRTVRQIKVKLPGHFNQVDHRI